MKHKRTCVNCNKDFMSTRSAKELNKGWGKCCSYKCMGNRARTRITKDCKVCGSLFERKPGEIKKGHDKYCSLKCLYVSNTSKLPDNYKIFKNEIHFNIKETNCIIDLENMWTLTNFKWNLNSSGYITTKYGIKLHKLILPLNDYLIVDHINGIKTDNRKSNLRPATLSENAKNTSFRKNNTSGFMGVHKAGSTYRAKIQCNNRAIDLGRFKSPEEASDAYKKATKKYFGEFARENQ